MQILPCTEGSISLASQALSKGELVIYPTETCYGIAADATNSEAVSKILIYKGDRHRQISIAVDGQDMAEKYVTLNDIARNLYQNFLPGPITVISDSLHIVDRRLESAEGTLGIRIPDHNFTLQLIKIFGKPITATSANTSGKKEPYSLADWQKYTTQSKQAMVSLFLDYGTLAERPTSTVVDTTLNEPAILRQGEIVIPELPAQTFTSSSPKRTRNIGTAILGKYLNLSRKYPLIIALQGDLGAGKTEMTKGMAIALAIREMISSPTYVLLKEYPYALSKYSGMLYHLDTWRLADMSELESTLHLSAILKPGNILIIEWAGKAKSELETYQKSCAIIYINIREINDGKRQIKYAFTTPEWT